MHITLLHEVKDIKRFYSGYHTFLEEEETTRFVIVRIRAEEPRIGKNKSSGLEQWSRNEEWYESCKREIKKKYCKWQNKYW